MSSWNLNFPASSKTNFQYFSPDLNFPRIDDAADVRSLMMRQIFGIWIFPPYQATDGGASEVWISRQFTRRQLIFPRPADGRRSYCDVKKTFFLAGKESSEACRVAHIWISRRSAKVSWCFKSRSDPQFRNHSQVEQSSDWPSNSLNGRGFKTPIFEFPAKHKSAW